MSDFYFLPDVEPEPVYEEDLHDLMKWWRHGRATRTIWQAITDGYVVIFSIVVVSAMIISVVVDAQRGQSGCVGAACLSAKSLLPAATALACYALSLALARLFGPILASAAEGFWLMDAPISRRRLLRGRMILPVAIAAGVGLVLTGAVSALSGLDWGLVAVWALCAGVGSAAMMALAAAQQASEHTRLLRTLQTFFTALALAVLLLVVSLATGWLRGIGVPNPAMLTIVAGAVGLLMVVVLIVELLAASRRLDEIRRSRLLSGGSLVAGMQGAMFALDFGLIRDILVERKAVEKGWVKPTQGHGLGVTALIWRDAERLQRNPRPLVTLLLSLFVPYAADALGMGQLNPLLSGLALMVALIPTLGSLRVLSRTGGLARSFPFPTTTLRTALMVVPALLALIWAAAATPAFVGISQAGVERGILDGYFTSLCVAAAGLFGGVRWVSAKKVDYQAPMMATESGAMPPSLIFNIFRGFDMIALITAPLILNWGAMWSGFLALVVFVGVRGTFNMDDMKAQSEQAQKDLAKARGTGPAGPKKKVPRPKGTGTAR
jgi:hypothetical protein